jgi:glycerophosphoryl diester phosphodiesterase
MSEKIKKPFKERKWWKILAIILAVILLFFAVCWVLPKPQAMAANPFRIDASDTKRPMLIAHGGGNKEFPDNTLEAFYNAYSIDKNCMMETDVSITKDGVVILSHDITLSRKTNLNKAIYEVTYAELMATEVDFNYANATKDDYWADGVNETNLTKYKTGGDDAPEGFVSREVVPTDVTYPDGVTARHSTKFLATTLEQLIKAFPNNTINVEIKQSGEAGFECLDAVIELMSDLDAEYNTFNRLVVASFHKEIFDKTKEYQKTTYPKLMNSPETKGVIKFFILQALGLTVFHNEKIAVFQVPMKQMGIKVATKGFVRKAHKQNIAVHYWTINSADDMRTLCDIKADGIMTDYPTLLKTVYDDIYGAKLSPDIVN